VKEASEHEILDTLTASAEEAGVTLERVQGGALALVNSEEGASVDAFGYGVRLRGGVALHEFPRRVAFDAPA